MSRFWVLAVLALMAALVASCGDEEEAVSTDSPPSASATPTSPTPPSVPATSEPPTSTLAPTPAATSGWITYTDPSLGFSLRHPSDLEVSDLSPDPGQDGLNYRVLDFRSPIDRSRGLSIAVSSNVSGLTPEKWALEYTACLPETVEVVTIKGDPAISCTADALGPHPQVVIGHEDNIYSLGWTLASGEGESVLSSLQLQSS